ncbi:hypothetical protein fugu_007725 [Takifugu bimaculatus]|uniref:Uncharacterized protein n=1 Tax=Takifugu bimaculatus TaxID=433685 RepID=A0A4Z2AZE8_9TELE|nr:hypothetical protein fugu_007725 [Takifugu bimaculatus]
MVAESGDKRRRKAPGLNSLDSQSKPDSEDENAAPMTSFSVALQSLLLALSSVKHAAGSDLRFYPKWRAIRCGGPADLSACAVPPLDGGGQGRRYARPPPPQPSSELADAEWGRRGQLQAVKESKCSRASEEGEALQRYIPVESTGEDEGWNPLPYWGHRRPGPGVAEL